MLGTVTEKMNYRFNIIKTVPYRIVEVLETMFELTFSQVIWTKLNPCNIFDSKRIVAVKKQIWRMSSKIKNIVFEYIIAIAFSDTGICALSALVDGKKDFLKKLGLILK